MFFFSGTGVYSEEEPDEGCDECGSDGWVTYKPIGYGEPISKVGSSSELKEWAKTFWKSYQQDGALPITNLKAIDLFKKIEEGEEDV